MVFRVNLTPRQITSKSFESTFHKNYDQLIKQISFERLSIISRQLSNLNRKYLLKRISKILPQEKSSPCIYQNLYDASIEGNFQMFKYLLKHYAHLFTQFDISTSFELASSKKPFSEENKKILYHLLRYFQHLISKESIRLACDQLSSTKDQKLLDLFECYFKTNISIQVRKVK